MTEFAKLWTLADPFMIPRLQNVCIESIHSSGDMTKELQASRGQVDFLLDRTKEVLNHAHEVEADTPLKRFCISKFLHMIASFSTDQEMTRKIIDCCLEDSLARRDHSPPATPEKTLGRYRGQH